LDNKTYIDYLNSPIGYWICKADDNYLLSIQYNKTRPEENPAPNHLTDSAKTQLEEYFNCQRQSFYIPMATHKYSHFYQEVWQELIKVPYGKLSTYSDIAIHLNNPKAVRAVGMANGKNPFAIVIPCHRIIGKNNSLTGYASGLEIKKWLLQHEGSMAIQTSMF